MALISILASSRFFYFGVIGLTYAVTMTDETYLTCENLIPSYLTEIFFCLFVLYHIFAEGQRQPRLQRASALQDSDASATAVTDTIPLYIVEETIKAGSGAQPPSFDLNSTSPIFKYAAVDNSEDVLLV